MSDFTFHPDAVKDLEEIWEHIATDSRVPHPDVAHFATSGWGF